MLKGRRLLSLLIALTILAISVPVLWAESRSLIATVQHVADGDTLTALTENGTKLSLRPLGIDAPEIAHGRKPGQPYGKDATEYLGELVGGKRVRLETWTSTRRVLAVAWAGLLNVNFEMLRARMAEV